MNKTAIIFCVLSLVATVAFARAMFPLAAMSPEQVLAVKTPIEPELMDDVSVKDFGEVPVLDMVLHYIDNPPETETADTGKIRFQGC